MSFSEWALGSARSTPVPWGELLWGVLDFAASLSGIKLVQAAKGAHHGQEHSASIPLPLNSVWVLSCPLYLRDVLQNTSFFFTQEYWAFLSWEKHNIFLVKEGIFIRKTHVPLSLSSPLREGARKWNFTASSPFRHHH